MSRITSVALAASLSFAIAGIGWAQTSPTTPPSSSPSSTTSKSTETPPIPGANSFTEAQAKERMEQAGFTQVSNLKKDDQGIWRARATREGKQVSVALDFRGNVVAQ
jgi:hypothetical protein